MIKNNLRHYFNLQSPISGGQFFALYILVTLLWALLLVLFVAPPNMFEAAAQNMESRFPFGIRLFLLGYELFLIPLYVRRTVDLGWAKIQRDLLLMGVLLAPVLDALLSDGGYVRMAVVIAFFSILDLILTFALFVLPSAKKER